MMASALVEAPRHGVLDGANLILLPESTFRKAGAGPVVAVPEQTGRVLSLTLTVTRMIDQSGLSVSIFGSADGTDWESGPLVSLPRMYYCGSHVAWLDLANQPDVRYLRAAWDMSRWARDGRQPLFTFQISVSYTASLGVAGRAGSSR